MENEENKEGILTRMYNKIDNQTKGEIAGISTEVGAGLALDAKTQWMLGAGPWGWLGYGVTNFIGGAGANIAAQKMRGEENIKTGEVISSGFLGVIPGTSLRFAKPITKVVGEANTVKRAVTFGATQGLTDQVIQKGIDEKRLPTPSEAALGLGVGGVVGGVLKDVQLNPDESGKLRIMLGKVNDSNGFKRFKWFDVDSKVLNRVANTDNKVLSKVQSTIDMMDDWRFKNKTAERPMTGFLKEHGKPTFWFENKEWGIGWSRSKNNYEIFDVQKRIERRASRLAGDKISNPNSASLRQIKEALRRDLNKQAKDLPVEQWDVMIQNPGDAYVEHLIAVKSPYWKSSRGKNAGYLAGDSKNLKVLTDQRFKSLKDRIERHVHANHKDLYVDYDPITQNLVLKNLNTGKALPTQIPGYGRPSDWDTYLEDALTNRSMKSVVDVSPETPSNIQRQIDSQLKLEDFSEVEINALLDYSKGMSMKNLKLKYGKKINRQNLELNLKGISKAEAIQRINAYKLGGKGRTKL